MNLRELARLLPMTYWAVIAVLVVVLAATGWWALTEPGRQRQRAAEAAADSQFSTAGASSAKDALKTAAAGAQRETEIDRQAKEAEDEIRNAPDDQRNAVARARLCLRDAYARDPACIELRRSHPGGMD